MNSELEFKRATHDDVVMLASMMQAFYHEQGLDWQENVQLPALELLIATPAIGFAGLMYPNDHLQAQCVGFGILNWGFDVEQGGRDAFLTDLYLEPSARGQGLGREAMSLLEETARDQGARAIHLLVRPVNIAALKVYRGVRFEEPGRLFLTKPLGRSSQ